MSVQVINTTDVLKEAYGPNWLAIPYSETCLTIRAWCEGHDAHYYARPREEFFLSEAVSEAEERGHLMVVVEDLS